MTDFQTQAQLAREPSADPRTRGRLRIETKGLMSSQRIIRCLDVLTLLLFLGVFVLIFGRLVSPQRFSYDESDYVYAASKGFIASYLDQPSLPIIEFVRTGRRAGLDPSEWRKLSEYIRHSDDLVFYRHFHGPLYFYTLEFIQLFWGPKEFIVRWASLLSLMLTAVIVYGGSLALAGQQGRFVSSLAVGFLLLSPTNVETARWVAPHSLYAACAMATLFFLAKFIQTNKPGWLYGALLCLGMAFLVIEYAPLLLITLAATLSVQRSSVFARWSRKDAFLLCFKCTAIPLLVIGALWPASLYKLSLVKNYMFFIYYVIVRGQEYGTDSQANVWLARVMSSPLEYLLLLSLSWYFLYRLCRKRELVYLFPFFLYAALMFLTSVRNRSESANYVSSFLPPLAVISAFAVSRMLDGQPKSWRVACAALIVSGLAANNYWFYYRIEAAKPPDERLAAIVNILEESGVRRERLLVPTNYRPTIHYYFQGTNLSVYTENSSKEEVYQLLANGNFDGVVYEGSHYEELRRFLEENCSVRPVIRLEAERPGRAVVYYRLLSVRSASMHFPLSRDQRPTSSGAIRSKFISAVIAAPRWRPFAPVPRERGCASA